jgi:predicted ABC-type ATPase
LPWFWIVAGPNGAGKTTLVERGIIQAITGHDLVTLNADVRTRELLAADPLVANANLRAAIEIDGRVAAYIEQRVNFLVETVLSSDKYLDDIDRARSLGYQVGMIYIGLATAADSIRRVALRRARGGHDVPTDRVVSRWSRSIAMLGRVKDKLDRLFVFDNTRAEGPRLIALGIGRQVTLLEAGRIAEIDAVLSPVRKEAR